LWERVRERGVELDCRDASHASLLFLIRIPRLAHKMGDFWIANLFFPEAQ